MSSKCSKVALPCFLARYHPMRGCQTPQIGIRLPPFLVLSMTLRTTDMEPERSKKNSRKTVDSRSWSGPSFPWLQPLFHFLRCCQHPNHPRPTETHTGNKRPAASCSWCWHMLTLILLSFGHQTWQQEIPPCMEAVVGKWSRKKLAGFHCRALPWLSCLISGW